MSAISHAIADACPQLTQPPTVAAPSLWEWAHDTRSGLGNHNAPNVILIFDQFEELFTLGRTFPKQVQAFIEALAALVENAPPADFRRRLESDRSLLDRYDFDVTKCRVLISIRADFLSEVERYRKLMPSLAKGRYQIELLTGPQALDAVYRPGTLRSGDDPIIPLEIAEQIVRRVARADDGTPLEDLHAVPPLVSLFCSGINAKRLQAKHEAGARVTSALVQTCGDQILPDFYASAFADVPSAAVVRAMIEDALVTEGGFRQSLPLPDAVNALRKLGLAQTDAEHALNILENHRLLSVEAHEGSRRVELIHDLLLDEVRKSRLARKQHEAEGIAASQQRRITKTEALLGLVLTDLAASLESSAKAKLLAAISGYYEHLDEWELAAKDCVLNRAILARHHGESAVAAKRWHEALACYEHERELLAPLANQPEAGDAIAANARAVESAQEQVRLVEEERLRAREAAAPLESREEVRRATRGEMTGQTVLPTSKTESDFGTYDIFISYSRKDDMPQGPGDTGGWVTAVVQAILTEHRRFSTEPLRVFFDKSEIHGMDDWRHRQLHGLRSSRILIVFMSPNYFASDSCQWEFEEYQKRQIHQLMGLESIAPIYLVEVAHGGIDSSLFSSSRSAVVTRQWFESLMSRAHIDLRPWFSQGTGVLHEVAVRESLAALGTSLWERIQRARRATGVPGNLRRLNPHFIGRRTELRQLHESLALGAVGVVTAVHGLGGQGKTELVTAYAHGWADSYPAGLWVLGAEGKREILPLLGELCVELGLPASVGPDETNDVRGRRVLAELKRRALEAAPRDPDKGASCLVILDNVSEPALLAEPQLAQIPREDWLHLLVTTREGPEQFAASRRAQLGFIAVDALTEDDAARLIEDHQPDGQWPAATAGPDSAAAREIARELGGFTFGVESVAIYLGLHSDIRPADYLARLRAGGLTGVDALSADADVAAQMQHREKQLRLVLDQTLDRLAPAERTALDYAALLPPDSIPWPWLRKLVGQDYPEATDPHAELRGYPDQWSTLRRRIEGLRLLIPGDHTEIARLHRMVASHLRAQMGHRQAESLKRLLTFLHEDVCYQLEENWMDGTAVLWMLGPLESTLEQLLDSASDSRIGLIASVVGAVEGNLGRLDRSVVFLRHAVKVANAEFAARPRDAQATRIVAAESRRLAEVLDSRGLAGDAEEAQAYYQRSLEVSERLWVGNQESAQAARDLSVSLEKLGDFLARRGQPGDEEKAMGHYQRSLEVSERLLGDNPESAQAARDMSVSLGRMGGFLARRGQPGDAEAALGHYQRSLEVSERMQVANPESAQAARDLSVSLNKLADFLASRGLPGDAEKALGHYQRSLEVAERLLVANPESAQAARDVSVSLGRLGDFLASRGLPGDAEKALAYYTRDLEISERLLGANPESAEAQRDVLVSLERMAKFEGGRPGGEAKALEFQTRALGIALKLRESNPQSLFYGDTAARAFFFTYQRAQAAGQVQLAKQCLGGCHAVLHELITAGCHLDPQMMNLYKQLHAHFGGGN